MLYGTTLNGPLVQAVKKGRNASPMELLEMETFSLKLKACEKERENEVMAEKALRDEVAPAETEETEESKLASGKLAPVPSKYQRGSVVAISNGEFASMHLEQNADPCRGRQVRAQVPCGAGGPHQQAEARLQFLAHDLFAAAELLKLRPELCKLFRR